jgi:deoxyinosine 3'endonuclease (endonuclease V)
MFAAFDVHYPEEGGAQVAAVVFAHLYDSEPVSVYRKRIESVAEYVPGEFYKRELPCILSLLEEIVEPIDTIIIDGYVSLGDRPGLGEHLAESMDRNKNVVGVAKTFFDGSSLKEAKRGLSKNPLFVTSFGLSSDVAKEMIESMHGPHRMPTLLKEADRLSKEKCTTNRVT